MPRYASGATPERKSAPSWVLWSPAAIPATCVAWNEPFVEGSVPCVKGNQGCGSCKWCDRWLHAVSCPENLKERLKELEGILAHAVGKGGV